MRIISKGLERGKTAKNTTGPVREGGLIKKALTRHFVTTVYDKSDTRRAGI